MDVATIEVGLLPVALLGVGVGYISGLFGVGGGFLLTPLLGVVLGVPMPVAVGSGLCQMVGSTSTGFLKHRELGQGEPRFAILMLPGSLLGVTAAAQLVSGLEKLGQVEIAGRSVDLVNLVLYLTYLVFLLAVALTLGRNTQGSFDKLDYVRQGPLTRIPFPPFVSLPNVQLQRVSAPTIAYLGLVLGLLSGLLGISGGIALMPVLLYGFGFPFRQAAGTGIVVSAVTAVVGTIAHARLGHIHLPLAMTLLVGSTISAQFGAAASHRLGATTLRRALAATVLMTAVLVAYRLVRLVL